MTIQEAKAQAMKSENGFQFLDEKCADDAHIWVKNEEDM